jgi:DNA-binding response OmpR family regulator
LTVDDSRAIRSIVAKQVNEMGFELDEACDGEEGLARLAEVTYDLVVLDVTMPNLDGPGMLRRMREAGDKTPVLMLTSESKRSIMVEVMKLGIDDYILKPFKAEELRAKIAKVLNVSAHAQPGAAHAAPAPAAHGVPAPAAAAPAPLEVATPTTGKQFIDVLVVDDMENVQKKLRSFLPAHLSLNGCASAQSALSMCRERVYRVILIDTEIPDVNSVALMNQIRILQPHAACLALSLRTVADADRQAQAEGYDDTLLKPFQQASIEDFLLKYFDNQELLFVEDNLLRVGAFVGKEERLDRYFRRLTQLIPPALDKVAAACFDELILDISQVPLRPDHTPRLISEVDKHCKRVGLSPRIVGTSEGAQLMKQFAETCGLAYFGSLSAARAA